MVKLFIDRPILSLVISIFIVLLGVISLTSLPVSQFPEIVPPSVSVTAKYTGANAEVCVKAVTTPLERAINGVSGMTYMSSVASNNGTTIIQVFFEVGTDPDIAAVNVQNRVATVMDELPEEVIKAGVSTEKEVNGMLMFLNLTSTDVSMDENFIYNFADINIIQELKRIEGVGFAEILGQKEYSMRVWLKPEKLIAYNLSTDEVIAAIRSQNLEAAPGKIGESSAKNVSGAIQYVLKYTGKYTEPRQYENIVIRSSENGSILKLKDIAEVEFGALGYHMISKTNGAPSASIMIKQRPGSNAKEIIENIKLKMQELKKTSFPPKMEYSIAYDVSRFLDASVHEVIKTLIEAFILVFIVVFIFLQDFRSTLIPVLAVPVALIGTFMFMHVFGFTINMLTLFALVLAIGIVVDDAIVVVEAVHSKMQELDLDVREATYAAMGEITSAIISITLVMSAVFIPVAFLSGPVGIFYKQFSLTMAFAIIISGINALTLTPALCVLILKNNHGHGCGVKILDMFFAKFNYMYNAVERRYSLKLFKLSQKRFLTIGVLGLFLLLNFGIINLIPTGFIPTEDQGMIYINVNTPAGSTVERTEKVLSSMQEISKTIPEIESISTLAGYSLMTESAGSSYGMGMINLKPWNERGKTAEQVIELLKEKNKNLFDGTIEFFSPPTVPGFGNSSGFELRLKDKSGTGNIFRTAEVTKEFMKELKASKVIKNPFTNFEANFPQYIIYFDSDKAAQKGVSVEKTMDALQALVGSYYASNFIKYGQMYKVMVQAPPQNRAKPDDILQLNIKNEYGKMIPLSAVMRIERVFGPEQITRYNMYTSALITGEPAEGYSSGDAISEVEKLASEKLPKGYEVEWSGMTREEKLSGSQTVVIFLICLLFVYLLLSAQYESFVLPLSVLTALPVGVFGTFLFLWFTGIQNNIYVQVALVMLIGLLGKNAILIIEFAELKRSQGYSIFGATYYGAKTRLRPILMTSFAFIAGLLPLCMAHGAGSMGNKSIGVSAVGGMFVGTVLGMFTIPGLYVVFAFIEQKFKKKKVEEVVH